MRIIIYALGRFFERYKDKIEWKSVAALADKNPAREKTVHGLPVIGPDQICDLEYDYIAVFTNQMFETIRMELSGEYFIPEDKIISWRDVLSVREPADDYSQCRHYQIFCDEKQCKRILDYGMSVLSGSYLTKEQLLPGDDVVLDGILSQNASDSVNLYDNVYPGLGDCGGCYDAVLLWDEKQYADAEWEDLRTRAGYILWHTGYLLNGKAARESVSKKLQAYGKVSCISDEAGIFWIVDTRRREEYHGADMAVYVVTHRKYNIRHDFCYTPLCVGGYCQEGSLSEQRGENIAGLNQKINECTALYWIWKNTDSEYVGLNHYRRFFYNNAIISMDNYLNPNRACEILEEYDIILPAAWQLGQTTVLDQIRVSIDRELCMKVHALMRRKIQEVQPGYLESFDSVMRGHTVFLCNMFLTRREILNQYCEWLFSFLISVAEEVDVEGYDKYSQRVVGFFAERMWTVWLRKNKLKIRELPYVKGWDR